MTLATKCYSTSRKIITITGFDLEKCLELIDELRFDDVIASALTITRICQRLSNITLKM
jgi:hypothetical protein